MIQSDAQLELLFKDASSRLILSQQIMKSEHLFATINKYSLITKILVLNYTKISSEKMNIITTAQWPKLEQMHIEGRPLKQLLDEKMLELLVNTASPNLKLLNLNGNKLTKATIKILSQSNWKMLQHIVLGNNNIGDEGVEAMKYWQFPNIKTLDLSNTYLTQTNVALLLNQSLLFPNLNGQNQRSYSFVPQNSIKDDGILLLSKANFPNLSKLSLDHCQITEFNVFFFIFDLFPQMQTLILQNNRFKHPLPKIERLNVGNCDLRSNGIKYLVGCHFPHLTHLFMWTNNITDLGIRTLSKLRAPQLKQLDLWDNQIRNEGIHDLSHIDLPSISSLTIWQNPFNDFGFLNLGKLNYPNFTIQVTFYEEIDKQFSLQRALRDKFQHILYNATN